jgi:hypothetical protein
MNQSKINLDSKLFTILSAPNFDKFTVLELRDAYLDLFQKGDMYKVEARRFVYMHILRLEKKGFLKRAYSKNKNKPIYIKAAAFNINNFKTKKPSLNDVVKIKPSETPPPSKDLLQRLIDRLQGYKIELLTSIGETDEYKSLCLEYPQLKDQLQASYNLARENSQKIIGKVKALEKSIKQQRQDTLTE